MRGGKRYLQVKNCRLKATTLVEVMIATAIFMVISIGSIYFFGAGGKGGTKAKSLEFALEFAESGMEEIKTWGYKFVANTSAAVIRKYGIDFTRGYPTEVDKVIYRVYCATVTWTDRDLKPKEINLFTIIAPDE